MSMLIRANLRFLSPLILFLFSLILSRFVSCFLFLYGFPRLLYSAPSPLTLFPCLFFFFLGTIPHCIYFLLFLVYITYR
ncbi:hypothetical protein DFH11DRAFT_1604793 [Phellopilus nigrolimitatus]|nr:hypothetical protein DFH11DRAFT_1604793 [Phellopilus nigrolimitatus]